MEMEKKKNKDLKSMFIGIGVIFLYLVVEAIKRSRVGIFPLFNLVRR